MNQTLAPEGVTTTSIVYEYFPAWNLGSLHYTSAQSFYYQLFVVLVRRWNICVAVLTPTLHTSSIMSLFGVP